VENVLETVDYVLLINVILMFASFLIADVELEIFLVDSPLRKLHNSFSLLGMMLFNQ
jgi:hypothetical protein